MCIAPLRLKDGTTVACRYCSLCRQNRLNDYVGRCIAEQEHSSLTVALTLTYAGDVPEAAFLNYSDFQKFIKRLRKEYSVRYIVAGEYGSAKGRAHWHCILFFKGNSPSFSYETRVNWPLWPHGFIYAQTAAPAAFQYILKYALKNSDDRGATKTVAMSKKPPIGYSFFMELAADLVEKGLPLPSPVYRFAHVRNKNGGARRYWLRGRMKDLFCERYVALWRERFGAYPPETEWLMEQYLDPIARREMDLDVLSMEERLASKQPYLPPPEPAPRDRAPVALMLLPAALNGSIMAYNDGTAVLDLGGDECLIEHGGNVAGQLSLANLPPPLCGTSAKWLLETWGSPFP